MPAKDIVLEVLRAMAAYAAWGKGVEKIVFTKAEFIATYWALRRMKKIPHIKIETLLRYLRMLAEEGEILSYASERGGKYVLNTLKLPW